MKAGKPSENGYRIAHLSDLHLTGINRDFECCLALVVDAGVQGADHLVISGDLVESGEMDVLKAFVDELRSLGWAGSSRLTIIPGNHDIFPISFRKLSRIRRPTSIFNEFAAITRGSRTGKGFRSLERGLFYPFGKVLSDQVVLVGLDTTRNEEYNPMNWAAGELSENQMAAAEAFLTDWEKVAHRIVVMHHSPWRESFVHGFVEQNFVKPSPEKVWDWIEGSPATLVLCGHVHSKEAIEKERIGKGRFIFRAATAGGVNEKIGGFKQRIYHLIDLNPGGAIRIHAREFNDCDL